MYSLVRAKRLLERHPRPALDDLRTRRAKTENEPPARQMIERHRRHRGASRRARAHLRDRRAEPYAGGLRAPPRERGQRVRAVCLRAPQRSRRTGSPMTP